MTKYYLYVMAGATIDESSRWFRVAIGASAAERRVLSSLQFYAAGHGHYFKCWCREVDEFLGELVRHYPDNMPLVPIKGAQLLAFFKHGALPAVPSHVLTNMHYFNMKTSSAYLSSCRRIGMQFAQAERRKKPKVL